MANSTPLDLSLLGSALERGGQPWEMSYTSMTALTEDQRVVRLGVPLEPNVDDAKRAAEQTVAVERAVASTGESVGAPASFDLRNVNGLNYGTPVKDQGACGSCVAFGTAGTMEHIARYTKGTPSLPLDLAEAHLFYCYGRQAGARCSTGWWPDQALNAARDGGVAFEDQYPYVAGDQDCAGLNAAWQDRQAKVTDWQYLTGNPGAMKEYISTFGSVTACFEVYQDFFSYKSGVYRHVTGSLAGGHCVVLIGYDDARGCWIAKNSWGTGWGDGGYVAIGYGEGRIESYQTCGVRGINLRAWLPDQRILGLWSNDQDGNDWAYGETRGWLKLDGTVVPTNHAMMAELAASKATNRPVGLFEDNGSVQQIYAW